MINLIDNSISSRNLQAALEFTVNYSSRCFQVKASPDEALNDSAKKAAPATAKVDLQAVLLMTHDNNNNKATITTACPKN